MNLITTCVSSDIFMADGFSDLRKYVENINGKALWIFDTNTSRMVKPLPESSVVLENGEASKSFKSVETILKKAFEENISRDDVFVAMGGGVVGDTAAFSASIYKRGCKLILIPTTLLAMADASIGGKTGINFNNCKNCVGSFYPAQSTVICTDCLQTLSENAFLNGLGEIIKTAFLAESEDLLKELVIKKADIMKREDSVLRKIVELSVKIKSDYVNRDPYEKEGIRQALNLGHTFGHALESLRRMNVNHGQAVAWGVCKAALASKELNLCSPDFADSVVRLYSDYGFDTEYKINFGEWYEYKSYLRKDKKIQNNELKFVLLKGQGNTVQMNLEDRLIKKLVIEGPEVQDVLL